MRNIVLITWDSVRADHCSCYGYNRKTTPFLDRLAKRGIMFQNAIVSGVPTPISMGGIFTSKHFSDRKITTETTLAQILSREYKTAAFHSNPYASRFFGFDKGFQVFKDYVWMDEEGYRSGQTSFLRRAAVKLLKNLKIVNVERVRFYYTLANTLLRNMPISKLSLQDFYNDVLDWIRKSSDNYFLWILMIEPHFPYAPPSWSRWKKARSILIHDKFYKVGGVEKKTSLKLEDKEREIVIDAYDDCIREADSLTKQLWKDLKDADPIFIIHADHGDAFGEHGFYGHPPEHYEYLIRVPLVIYNADVKGVVKEPVSLLRLAPTICELAGVENEFKNPSLFEDVEYSPPMVENKLEEGLRVTVRDKEWKLIVNPDRWDELYNIKKDPLEKENLIGQEIDIERELRKLAEKHMKSRMELEKLTKGIERLKGLKGI